MTDAKSKDHAMKEHPNLGQDEAAEEREGKEKMEYMKGDKPRREGEKAKERQPEKSTPALQVLRSRARAGLAPPSLASWAQTTPEGFQPKPCPWPWPC
jgi:hypothetical protein